MTTRRTNPVLDTIAAEIDNAARGLAQTSAAIAHGTVVHEPLLRNALERAADLFTRGYWAEARAVLALAMGE